MKPSNLHLLILSLLFLLVISVSGFAAPAGQAPAADANGGVAPSTILTFGGVFLTLAIVLIIVLKRRRGKLTIDAQIVIKTGESAGRIYILEANPNPDIAYGDEFAEAARAGGVEYTALIARILRLALRRYGST